MFKSINPSNLKLMKDYPCISYEEAALQIKEIRKNLSSLKENPMSKRLQFIKEISGNLEKNKRKCAEIISNEVGRPLKDSISEIEKCISLCSYYVKNAEDFLKDQVIATESHKSYVSFEPLGIVFGIMPWNYPFWQAFRSIIPALCAGNAYVLKHASNVPQCALSIEEAVNSSGFRGNFKNLFIDSPTASKLIETDLIQAVSFTGSTEVGKKIAEAAGRNLKKAVLELGGSDAFIIFKDANIKKAVKEAIESRFLNSGQSCNAAKRFIVVKEIEEEFTSLLLDSIRQIKVGNPLDENTTMGPLANEQSFNASLEQITDAEKKGAKVHGGKKLSGYYLEPALISKTSSEMKVVNEETFGPIAVIISVNNEEEVVKEANRSSYGLGASIWTADLEKAEKLAKKIEAGSVYVNKKVRSDPRMPFGGIKNSGLGRELGEYGLKEFTNIKSIIIEK